MTRSFIHLRPCFAREKVPTIDSGFVPIQKFPFLRSTGSTFSISKCHAWNATHIVLHRLFPNRQGHGNVQRLAEFSYFLSILGRRYGTGEKKSQDESYELMTSRVDDGTAKGRRQERGGKHFRRTTKERQGFVLIIDDIRHSSIYSARSRLTTKEHDERQQTRGSCRAAKHDAEMANAVFHAFNAHLIA